MKHEKENKFTLIYMKAFTTCICNSGRHNVQVAGKEKLSEFSEWNAASSISSEHNRECLELIVNDQTNVYKNT